MNTESLLYNIILVINVYDTVICQLVFEGGTTNFTKCGDSTLKSISPLVINGTNTLTGNFPWHAGLYYRKQINGEVSWEQGCGGSLITDQFVLTAAHCVYNTNENDVRAALGKIHRSWDHYEYGQQKRNVLNILYPYDFQEVTYYFDIALLLLDEKIRLGMYVMPVCSGFLGGAAHILNKTLYVVGWGQTMKVPSGSPSEKVLYTDVSFLPKNTCQRFVPTAFVMFDKFCTTKDNNTEVSVLQKGDSGGGLTVVNDGKHYITGIVSTNILGEGSQITLFTNITWPFHISWLEREVKKYHSRFKWSAKELTSDITRISRGCVLPTSPSNRRFCTLANGCEESCNFENPECLLLPGSSVDKVKVVCDPGSTLNTSGTGISVCLKNEWDPPIPVCNRTSTGTDVLKSVRCFINKTPMPVLLGDSKELVGRKCVNSCAKENYRYALLYDSFCFCNNTEPVAELETSLVNCNRRCNGDRLYSCGGLWSTSVYTTDSILQA